MEKFEKDILEIKGILEKLELSSILQKAEKYDKFVKYLNEVKIDLKSASLVADNNGDVCVKVEYQVPSILLRFDTDGNLIRNERFYSMNMLDLLSLEDFNKITEKIEEAKRKNNF